MKTYNRNEHVPAGLYWDPASWEIVTMSGKAGGRLPASTGDQKSSTPETDRVVRLNPVAGLLMAPMLGAMFVMFLPFAGFVLLAEHAGKKIARLTKSVTEDVASSLMPVVRHGHAYLTGRKGKKVTDKEAKHIKN